MTKWHFELGDTVYLKTDTEQLERIVTERKEQIGGTKQYGLSTDLIFSFHYHVEVSNDFNELIVLNIREKEEH